MNGAVSKVGVKVGRGLDVIKDYCRVGESGAWLRRYKGLLPGR